LKVGVIGAGQLGRMLALAGYPLGVRCEFYDRTADTPGGQVGPITTGEFDDLARLRRLARRVDVLTFDWENVPVASLAALARSKPAYPQPAALAVAQDRLLEKTLFRDLGIPTPAFAPVDLRRDLEAAVACPQDAPLRLRRQGAGAHRTPRRLRARLARARRGVADL
jgi:5-(carboxyamino)imidazole ribonucleotide synthase